MAQLSSNSQGTIGIEGNATASSISDVLKIISYMALIAVAIAKKLNDKEPRHRPDKVEEKNEDSLSETELGAEDNRQSRLTGDNQTQTQIEGRDQKRLKPSPEHSSSEEAIAGKGGAISRKENLAVSIQIGDHHIEDKYENLPSRFENLTEQKKQALVIAMAGGLPSESVSIKVRDEFGRKSEFSANNEKNNGWQTSGESSKHLSAQAVQQEVARQRTTGTQKIKETMKELSSDGGPHVFSGQNLVIYSDADEVVVVDKNSGIIRDVERLETIGNQGQQAVRESAREAAASFSINGSAAKGIASRVKSQKQRQITR